MAAQKKMSGNARTQRALGMKLNAKAKRARPAAESERLRKLATRVRNSAAQIDDARLLPIANPDVWLGTVAKDLANAVEYLAAQRYKGKPLRQGPR